MLFMKILLNGEPKKLDSQTTLNDLVLTLGLKLDQIVIEVNGNIIPRNLYLETKMQENDEVEIIQMLGGG